jgi:dTDP-4-dehydrorhamnose reductase
MMSGIMITGAGGQLGRELSSLLEGRCITSDIADLDITNEKVTEDYCNKNKPNAIINCAAYTAVDKAESDSEAAYLANDTGAKNLARAAKNLGIPYIHISTDFVFDGKKSSPYSEEDAVNPLGIYGMSKYAGEQSALSVNPDTLIIRTSWVYASHGKNFVKTMLHYGKEKGHLRVVADQIGTPTWARDLAKVIIQILPEAHKGYGQIFNYSQEGVASWYDFACAVMELGKVDCSIEPIETSDYPTAAARPPYSVLNKKKIKTVFGIKIPHWRVSLAECMKEMQ